MRNLDYIVLDDESGYESNNGFMSVMANLTRTGVFHYFEKKPDGTVTVIRQLRHPDEVFAETTLQTLMGLPATNQHPEELVSKENAKEYMVGMTSDRPKKISFEEDSEDYVQQNVTFFDSEAIKMIIDGDRREMSLGYTCDLEKQSGEWNGESYDYVQRNINYNHLSLVDRARGGVGCKVLLDSEGKEIKDKQHIVCDGLTIINNDIEGDDSMKIFIADGKEYKVEDDVYSILDSQLRAFDKTSAELSDVKSKLDKSIAQFDEAQAKLDAKDDQVADKKKTEDFNKAVSAKVTLVSRAQKIVDSSDDLSGLSDREIKEKVITHIYPDIKLDGKSDAYVDARFDIAVEGYKKPDDADKLGKSLNTDSGDSGVVSYKQARAKAWERDQKLGRSAK